VDARRYVASLASTFPCSKKPVSPVYIHVSTAISVATRAANRYVPHGRNELHTIFARHFADFCNLYDEKYAATYSRYRLERIQQLGERFCTCGDYLEGVARIRCTNPECGLVSGYCRLLGHASGT
jgi:hypothetical protein